jgi:hypothetical protein
MHGASIFVSFAEGVGDLSDARWRRAGGGRRPGTAGHGVRVTRQSADGPHQGFRRRGCRQSPLSAGAAILALIVLMIERLSDGGVNRLVLEADLDAAMQVSDGR